MNPDSKEKNCQVKKAKKVGKQRKQEKDKC